MSPTDEDERETDPGHEHVPLDRAVDKPNRSNKLKQATHEIHLHF
jgi:hypothetical protein